MYLRIGLRVCDVERYCLWLIEKPTAHFNQMDEFQEALEKQKKVCFLINPTVYEDFDVIAVGEKGALKRLHKKHKESEFIKKSAWGFSLVIIDTFDEIEEALNFIKNLTASSRIL